MLASDYLWETIHLIRHKKGQKQTDDADTVNSA